MLAALTWSLQMAAGGWRDRMCDTSCITLSLSPDVTIIIIDRSSIMQLHADIAVSLKVKISHDDHDQLCSDVSTKQSHY